MAGRAGFVARVAMIPRKEAKRLLEEFIGHAREYAGIDGDGLDEIAGEFLRESDLVLRGSENIEQKGRRYLTEGRIVVSQVGGETGLIVAHARGTGAEYALGFDPKRSQWRCTCGPSGRKGHCSHIIALQLVTMRPTTTGGT